MRGLLGSLLGVHAEDSDEEEGFENFRNYWKDAGGGPTFSGRHVSADASMRVSAVYACVNILAKIVASLPLSMYRSQPDGESFEAPEHPLNELLEHQPNSWQTAWDFRAMLMMHLALRGNAYAEIKPGPTGAVGSLEPLHPDCVVPYRVDGGINYRVRTLDGESKVLTQDEIFHIRSAIAPSGIKGISPIAYARETIGLALAAEEHGARQFSNGARPSGWVGVKNRMSDPAFDRFKEEFRSSYHGLKSAGSTPILEEGAEFHPVTMTADELQFLQTREFEIEEIARWFDVPLVMLNSHSKTTSWGTGVETIMLAFVRTNLMPWLGAWTQAIRRDLIVGPAQQRVYSARFDVNALQRGDSKAQADFFSRLVLAGIIVRNEARNALGYNSLEGLSEPLVPLNSTPPTKPPAYPEQPDPDPADDTGDVAPKE